MSGVVLVGAVKGLVSEGERVSGLLRERDPDVIALAISPEGFQAMKAHLRIAEEEAGLDNLEEEIYVAGLEVFGEVRKPPPCFADAYEVAKELGKDVETLDLDDEEYKQWVLVSDFVAPGQFEGKREPFIHAHPGMEAIDRVSPKALRAEEPSPLEG